MKSKIDINTTDPDWAFGFSPPPSEEAWHCLHYEYFRCIGPLRRRFRRYWASEKAEIPTSTVAFSRIAGTHENRVLIGDLDAAAMLFLTPGFPDTPWLELSPSFRANVIKLITPNTPAFDSSEADPVYICSSRSTGARLNMLLLIDVRKSVPQIVSSFMEKLKSVQAEPNKEAAGNPLLGSPWEPYVFDLAVNEKKVVCETRFRNWLRANIVTGIPAQSPSYSHQANFKRLAVYRLCRFARMNGISVEELYGQCHGLYGELSDWYRNNALHPMILYPFRMLLLPWGKRPGYVEQTSEAFMSIVGRLIDGKSL